MTWIWPLLTCMDRSRPKNAPRAEFKNFPMLLFKFIKIYVFLTVKAISTPLFSYRRVADKFLLLLIYHSIPFADGFSK
jgi:hypothetical protein